MPVAARLSERLRNQQGWSYTAASRITFSAFENNGSLRINASYRPEQGQALQAAVHEELSRLVKQGITDAELQQAKDTLLQQSRESRSSDGTLLKLLLLQLRTGRTMQALADREAALTATTVDDVNAAIRQFISPDKLVEVLADPSSQQSLRHDEGTVVYE